jgi:FKBP-type peptidyl-prolyl cis-trans isomerase 2
MTGKTIGENWLEVCADLEGQIISHKVRIEALTAALEAHENHMTAGQTLAVKYLVPEVDPDSIGKDEFINRIIGHFDGPDQRTVQAKARAALEKQP